MDGMSLVFSYANITYRKMNACSNGKIYAIRSSKTKDVHIGSTTKSLEERLAGHRSSHAKWKAGDFLNKSGKQRYLSSFKLLNYDDHYIELVEEYQCDNQSNLLCREGEVIFNTDSCINIANPGPYIYRRPGMWKQHNNKPPSQRSTLPQKRLF